MIMQRKDELMRNGINVEKALRHMMGNEGLLNKYVNIFLNDDTFARLCAAIENNQREDAFLCAHALKSITASLGLTELNKIFVEQTELLRAGNWEEGIKGIEETKKEYKRVVMLLSS